LFQINGYSSARGAGAWDTTSASGVLPSFVPDNLMAPTATNVFANGMSSDGRFTVMGSDREPTTGERVPSRLYRVDLVTGAVQRITPDPVAGDPWVASNAAHQAGVVGNADFSEIFFSSDSRLTPASTGVPVFDDKLYRWANGTTELVSYSPAGAPQSGTIASSLDDLNQNAPTLVRNSMSSDGQTFWYGTGGGGFSGYPLFRGTVGQTSSTAITASENPAYPATGTGIIKGASPDGQRAVFWSRNGLVPGTTTGTLDLGHVYLYTHSANPSSDTNLTLISADAEPADGSGAVTSVLGVSDDTRTIYFASRNQLVAGETTAAGSKLYRWHDGTLHFIGLSPETVMASGDSQATPDGRYLAFSPKPAYDATGQAYRYDAVTGQLDCVSCPSSGPPVGKAQLAQRPTSYPVVTRPSRYLADDGRVTFSSTGALLPNDTNGRQDVYTWKDGELSLVSTGRSPSDSRLADASRDGNAIFFYTREALSGWDTDTIQDLYVARVDGGLPEPNPRPAEVCSGDACQGSWTPAAPAPVVGSVTFTGTGNVVTPPWTSAEPRVSRVKAVRSRTATLRVRVPAKGTVRVSGNRLRRATRTSSKAQTLRIRVRLSTLGERTRKRRGSVKVNVAVRYTPAEGRASTVRVPVTFRKAKSKSKKSKSSSSRTASTNAKGGR
ncbi:MAG: hypothetical protein ITG02_10615, partial [Patulibacter sp.]|nr:hypothetical protein [Patulibacter sp.]